MARTLERDIKEPEQRPADPGESWAAGLATAARVQDEAGFAAALHDVQRDSLAPRDWELAIRLALEAGAHVQARELAQEGAARWPDDPFLKKAACILAPPRLIALTPADPEAVAGWRADREWIRAHGAEYRGQWIALRAGSLLGAAPTVRELRQQLESTGVKLTPRPLITPIF